MTEPPRTKSGRALEQDAPEFETKHDKLNGARADANQNAAVLRHAQQTSSGRAAVAVLLCGDRRGFAALGRACRPPLTRQAIHKATKELAQRLGLPVPVRKARK